MHFLKRSVVVLILALMFLCVYANAAELPDFIEVPGWPWQVNFPDGRIAVVKIVRRPALVVPITFQVAENTCTEKTGDKFKFSTSLLYNFIFVQWLNHPDPKRVGQVVKIKSSNSAYSSDLSQFSVITYANKEEAPKIAASLTPHRIEGSDFSWLPKGSSRPPEKLFLSRWDSEYMQTNPETGISENRTVTLALNIHLLKETENKMVFENKKTLANQFSFLFGDIWSWVIKQDQGYCLISLKGSFAEAQAMLTKYFTTPPSTPENYLYGSDEYSNFAFIEEFRKFKNNPENYTLE